MNGKEELVTDNVINSGARLIFNAPERHSTAGGEQTFGKGCFVACLAWVTSASSLACPLGGAWLDVRIASQVASGKARANVGHHPRYIDWRVLK